jgi:hypothetical protein
VPSKKPRDLQIGQRTNLQQCEQSKRAKWRCPSAHIVEVAFNQTLVYVSIVEMS